MERDRKKGFWSRHIKLWIFLLLLIAAWVMSAGIRQVRAAALQQGISREVLRFHVLANSDSDRDQAVKLKVRDGILSWLEQQLTDTEQEDLSLMKQKTVSLLPRLEQEADRILAENGMPYTASATLGTSYFPEKTYGNCTFPPGNYCALRILLGEAKGRNWWCVLFPRLCFLDCVHAVLPEESSLQLEHVLTEEEYESLFDPSKNKYKIAFRYF